MKTIPELDQNTWLTDPTSHQFARFRGVNEAVSFENFGRPNLQPKQRGRCNAFTWASRQRLKNLLESYGRHKEPFKGFLCLTFTEDVKAVFAKKQLDRFLKVLNRRKIGFQWIMEFTKKGRIHYHILMTDYMKFSEIQKAWPLGRVHVESIYSEAWLRQYLLKEVQKTSQKKCGDFNGRWWGVSRWLNVHREYEPMGIGAVVKVFKADGFQKRYYRETYKKAGVELQELQGEPEMTAAAWTARRQLAEKRGY